MKDRFILVTKKIKEIVSSKLKGSFFLSIVLTLFYLYGDIHVYERELNYLSIIKYLFIFAIYYVAIKFVSYFLNNKINIPFLKLEKKTAKHIFWCTFLFLMIIWLPHLIMKYPMANNYDSYQQLLMGQGMTDLTAHYPLFATELMTLFYNFGKLIGDANIGMFLYALIETIVLALIFSYSIQFLCDKKVSQLLILISLIFYAFCPYITGYIGQGLYDVYYSGFIVLFVILIIEYLMDNNFWKNKTKIILLILACVLLCLFRKNGKYVIIPTLLVMFIKELKNKTATKLNIIVLIFCMVLPIVSYSALENYYDPIKGSRREALSFFFQQTARFEKYDSDLVTQEDDEIIHKVLVADDLADRYKEYISDPLKKTFDDNSTTQDLINYFKVWFKQFTLDPGVYFDATMCQNIYLVYPRFNNFVYFIDCNNELIENQNDGLLQTPLAIKNLQDDYLNFLTFLHQNIVFYFINNMATFVLLFFVVLLNMLNKHSKYFLATIPIILSLFIIILAPGIMNHVRYSFPIIWSFPLWISLLSIEKRK